MLTYHYRIIALSCALAFCPGAYTPARAQAAPQGGAAARSNEHDCMDDITVGVNVSPHVINPSAAGRGARGTTFDLSSLMGAYRDRRFYATEDINAQLVYGTADGSRVMGQSFSSSASSVRVRVEAHDPDGESAASIELWGGRLGSTRSPQRVAAADGDDTLDASIPRKPAGQEWYYYVKVRQADGDRIWSSPLWIRWN